MAIQQSGCDWKCGLRWFKTYSQR